MHSSPTGATGEAVFKSHLFPANVAAEPLKAMSLGQLHSLSEALRTVREVLVGLSCQPRFEDTRHLLNPAGDELNRLADLLDESLSRIEKEATARISLDVAEARNRAWILLQAEAWRADSVSDLSMLAAAEARGIECMKAREV